MQDPPIEALADWVVLEALASNEDTTPSGLLIPASASKAPNLYQKFRVVSAGPEVTEDRISEYPDPALLPGDVVFVILDETGALRYGGVEYRICRYDHIAAIVRDEIEEI